MMDEIKIVNYLSGELEQKEVKEVELWLELPENREEFNKIRQIWESSVSLKESDLFNTDNSWTSMKFRMDQLNEKKSSGRSIGIWKYAVAASLIFVLGISAFFYFQGSDKLVIRYATSEAKLGKPVELPDGTKVYLNRNTILVLDREFNNNTRTVSLSGEAYFDVAKNRNKPFIIRTISGAEIKVVGTSFNVMAYNASDKVKVSVQSGIVELYPKGETDSKIRLTMGNEGTFVKIGKKLLSQKSFDSNILAWKTNQLNFKDADMYYVASTLEHTFGKKIELDQSSFKNCRLNVNFNNQSLETVLKVIQETMSITIINQGEVYRLSGPGC
jgi:transmembrane sensor